MPALTDLDTPMANALGLKPLPEFFPGKLMKTPYTSNCKLPQAESAAFEEKK